MKPKGHIIILALLYKYISTKENSLNIRKIDRYSLSIDYSFYQEHYRYPIIWEDNDIPGIIYRDANYNYHFVEPINLDYICKLYIDQLPQEVLLESLKQEHLNIIDADQTKIRTNKVTERKRDTLNIYSMSANDAQASALRILKNEGAKNIKIGSAFYVGMKPDHLWEVYVNYEKDIIYIDFPGLQSYSSRVIGNQYIRYSEEDLTDILNIEFNEDNLTEEEIDKTTTKVRAFIYNPITDEALIVHYAGLYMLPGGKVDPYETNLQALTREIKEETGITITKKDATPYLVINSYDKNYNDRREGTINRHTQTIFYKIITTSTIDETKKQLTESEMAKNHIVFSIPIHNMKNLIESNDTTNSKRKQFDREIIVALNEFLKAIGYEEEPNKLTYKPSL